MASWQTIKSLLIFFLPLLLPRILSTYRAFRAQPTSKLKPLPPSTTNALTLLTLSALLALLSTLPLFHPPNIFTLTSSRLQTNPRVLFNRLTTATTNPPTPLDDALRAAFETGGLDARLLYARFGPDVVAHCPLAAPGDVEAPRAFLLYALPALLGPHLLHLLVLGLATSPALAGREAGSWRAWAVIAGLVLALAEVWVVGNYDDGPNARSTRLGEVGFLFWQRLVWRGIGVAGVDAALGWAMWVQGTGRGFGRVEGAGERVGVQVGRLEGVLGKVRGAGILRNGVCRDRGLRGVVEAYWVKEGEVMRDVMEEGEVVGAQRRALGRVDVGRVGKEAEGYLDGLLGGVEAVQAMQGGGVGGVSTQ